MKFDGFIAGAVVSAGLAIAGLGLAAPAQADPSYWHYCPGDWKYTVPVPPGTDMSVCHWFAATSSPGPGGSIKTDLREVDPSQLPSWAQPRPMCGFFPCQGGG
jgi:hypothetical protein